jgi:LmbE family N-acetylglucosaminyl deacetylase
VTAVGGAWRQGLRLHLGVEGARRPVEALGLERLTRALVVLAHPDDELNAAGLVQRLRAAGARVDLLVLTDGAANPWTDASAVGARTPFECRADEVRASAAVLGVGEVLLPGFPDSRLRQHLDAAAAVVRAEVSKRRPGLVVGFDARGINGHPDHVAAHQALRRALTDVADGPALAMLLPPPPFSWALGAGFRWSEPPTVATLTLSDDELSHKVAAFEAHRSQRRTLRLLTGGLPPRRFFQLFRREWFLWLEGPAAAAWARDEGAT